MSVLCSLPKLWVSAVREQIRQAIPPRIVAMCLLMFGPVSGLRQDDALTGHYGIERDFLAACSVGIAERRLGTAHHPSLHATLYYYGNLALVTAVPT
jgi:hypothetical protein